MEIVLFELFFSSPALLSIFPLASWQMMLLMLHTNGFYISLLFV